MPLAAPGRARGHRGVSDRAPRCPCSRLWDGTHLKTMPSAQDHKRAYDHDEGSEHRRAWCAFSPSRFYTEDVAQTCMETIFQPTVAAMAAEGRPFKGVLYFGLMLTPKGPRVIEYNARFGDPETQAVLSPPGDRPV